MTEEQAKQYILEHFKDEISLHEHDGDCGCYVDDVGLWSCRIGRWLNGCMTSLDFLSEQY